MVQYHARFLGLSDKTAIHAFCGSVSGKSIFYAFEDNLSGHEDGEDDGPELEDGTVVSMTDATLL